MRVLSAILFVTLSLFFTLPALAKLKHETLNLEFINQYSNPIIMPYPRHDGSKNGGSRQRLYVFFKDNRPYKFEDGICSVIGQEESPAGGFTYWVRVNKNGFWEGYIFSGHWPRGGIMVQCISHAKPKEE